MTLIAHIETLFDAYGHRTYDNARREPVSALEHALQCAQLAEWAGADDSLVAAALLHDIGHFVTATPDAQAVDDVHELRAVAFLAAGFGSELIEPIRLHVQAKRFLVATDPCYAAVLAPASMHSLGLQGGPMSADEVWLFEALPFSGQAVALRRWDDAAKQPGKSTPSLAYYLGLLEGLQDRPFANSRIGIGSFSVA